LTSADAGTLPPASAAAGDPDEHGSSNIVQMGAGWLWWLPLAVLIVGLAVTAALALVSHSQYNSNEQRLLRLRVRDAGALVTEALPGIETPLASASELADATRGDVRKFKSFVTPYVTGKTTRQFVSLSLWRLADPAAGPLAVVGAAPELTPSAAAAVFGRLAKTQTLNVVGVLAPPDPRLGYALSASGVGNGYVAYGESPLPANRRSRLQGSSAFAGLDYALFLGANEQPQNLLVTDLSHFPPRSRTDAETLQFGDRSLTLAMSAPRPLAGSLPQRLPLIIWVLGVLLSAAAALVAMRLTRRRNAEQLAATLEVTASENRRLYAEQRTIAQTLQHALLPDKLPQIEGVDTSARYEAGEEGVDIGGDWYDIIDLGDRRLLLVVGDVSGRGLRAATTMASLRYAIRAYAAQRDAPAEILTKVSHLISVAETGQLATILMALVDLERLEISITSAGHLPPLLMSNGDGQYAEGVIGLPIGVEGGSSYISTTIAAPRDATLVAFTDGLVEVRGESLDRGLQRLRETAIGNHSALSELLDSLVSELPQGPSEDDVAIVTIAGELDIAGVDSLQSEVAGVLARAPARLVVDVGRVRFADSSAIALWVRWAGDVSQFELRDPPPLLRKVVTAMGLAETLGLAQ
jgi:anti-anti-sigma factor